jgi:L-cysteine S-thiosulfotransferase
VKTAATLLAACLAAAAAAASEPGRPSPLQPGTRFQSEDVRALQADAFANPGMLWVTRGAQAWSEPAGPAGRSCAHCHGEASVSMKGVAARYPKFDASLGRVVDLDGRIDACRRTRQEAAPLARESPQALALGAFVAYQSRGVAVDVAVDGPARATWERGREIYFARIGQLNLACTHCHDANWGKTLLAEPISQGHPTGWPGYRLEWQALGSLQRRLRACFFGVRAEQPPYGSEDLVALELYLAWRARGLAVEAPGVRR